MNLALDLAIDPETIRQLFFKISDKIDIAAQENNTDENIGKILIITVRWDSEENSCIYGLLDKKCHALYKV